MATFNFKKGFTLIELMVAVAIIAVIASIVVSQLSQSRNKTADAAVKSNLDTIRSQAELFSSNNSNSYLPTGGTPHSISSCPLYGAVPANMLTRDKNIADAIVEAKIRGTGVTSCANSASAWAVAVELKSSTTSNRATWCVDSSGKSKQYTGLPAAAINATTLSCN